ncbi:MAG: hypothetical protein E6Q24_14755 [Chitinophagaceae bacterium]|nr:MAG: hypothetical protein E6Q24_14755 [Chitinophagaceae bacterium]
MDDKQLFEMANQLFTKRSSLVSLWQEVAENFYPERADFTVRRSLGTDFADNLTTSYPLMARRELGNSFSFMLRPTEKSWFHMTVKDEMADDFGAEIQDPDAKAWLQWAEKVQRKAMYDRSSMFIRATKEADHDFAAFGQCAISVEFNRLRTGLLYRCWHLRDMAWQENAEGKLGTIARKWKPTVRELVNLFGASKLHTETVKQAEKSPFEEADCMHIVVEADMCSEKFNTPYVSIYYDCAHFHTIEKVGVYSPIYVIPRWQTVSGSQYAYSPATVAALPDARLIQAMTLTMLEAGEKATNPPMIAVQEAIRSDISIYAGGITWVDSAYDERLGEVLRPISQDKTGLPLGLDMTREIRAMIAEAFYLNKLTLPQRAPEMTAYEVGQRIQQYIRDALPLFEPMETEYNGAICEETFNLLMRAGAFGSMLDLPKSLLDADIQFKFESPLHEAIEREKGNRFLEAQSYIAATVQLDPSTALVVDAKKALRDVLDAIGVPAQWINSEDEVEAIEEKARQQQEAAVMLEGLQQGADVAKTLGEAENLRKI